MTSTQRRYTEKLEAAKQKLSRLRKELDTSSPLFINKVREIHCLEQSMAAWKQVLHNLSTRRPSHGEAITYQKVITNNQ